MSDSPNPSPSPPQTPQSATQRLSRQDSVRSVSSPFSPTTLESTSFRLQTNTAAEDINEIESGTEHSQSHQLLLSPSFSTPLSFDSRVDETEPLFINERSVHQIPIYIETLTGTTFEMQIMSQETIYAVKFKLQVEEGIPVSQQHLLWQGEELKDEFTLDEYGIGFGAILRLVLGLRGGPLSESPLSTANSKETATCSSKQDISAMTGESQPLTVLIFQNGNHIKLLTIGTGSTTASLSTAGLHTAGSLDTGFASTSKQTDENGSRNTTSKAERRKKAKNERELENEVMRIKMDELRKKMKSMSIRKKQAKDASKKNASNKLPSINDDSKKVVQNPKNKRDVERQTPVHLPSIIPSQSTSAKCLTGRRESVQMSVSKTREENKADKKQASFRSARVRSTSLSPKNLFTMKDVNDKPNPLFYRLSSPQPGSETVNETSVCGSIAVIKLEKRPQTTPFLGRINEIRKIPTFKELQALVKSRNNSRKASAVKSKRIAESKLPPVIDKKRARCFQCKKRLGLATRYECRCGSIFCATHRYSEAHSCNFDYREEGKAILQMNNPPVRASKLPKI